MNDALLTTKLQPPPLRPDRVPRPRLTVSLNRALTHKLTLVTAPAGFGKTTLLREWLDTWGGPAAWLSLDEQDNSPDRFLVYLIHALRRLDPELGTTSLALLEAAHQAQLSTVMTHLANDLAALPDPRLIVLDDYHLIEEPAIHTALEFLIAHGSPPLHLIIAGRSQPPLSLARLRGQGQLLELTSADLRFTSVEVETFLKDVMRLELSPADRSALEMRTEGWIAGVQLAGLSLQAQADQATFMASFSGTDRYVGDYLFEEVLRHQPAEVRHFLLATAIVDSLCSGLGDALLADTGSQAMLERLDERQLFIVPLDNQRRWYRYHHLFGELLRHRLSQTNPDQVPVLHRRASLWFEQQGRLDDAIRHGLAARDFERTAGLIEAAFAHSDWVHRDMHRLLAWFEVLPDPVTRTRPRLALAYAWLLFEIFADRWDRIEAQLRQVEDFLTSPDAGVSFSEQDIAPLLAQVDLLRANQARQAGEPARVIVLCQQALDRLPDGEAYLRSGIIAHLASAYEDLGQMAQAGRIYTDSLRLCRAANNVDGLLFAAARLIEALTIGGQLRQAEAVFDQLHTYTTARTGPDMGLVFITIGQVYYEQNRLEQAATYLEQGLERCRPFEAWRAGVITGLIGLARLRAAEGDHEQALALLADIENEAAPLTPREQSRLASVRVRLLLAQDHFSEAVRWARRSGLATIDDAVEPDYADEVEQLTLVRLLLAQATLEAQGIQPAGLTPDPLNHANDLLDRLHRAALAGGRLGRVIEIRVLQARLQAIQQTTGEALQHLAEALSLAEPEGYVRLFVDEDRSLYPLLTMLASKPQTAIPIDYVQTLLAAFLPATRQSIPAAGLPGSTLTQRELKTLHLLATDLSIQAIAAEMTISVSSVRTYAKRIYSKLDAHSRAEAVYRARELKLL